MTSILIDKEKQDVKISINVYESLSNVDQKLFNESLAATEDLIRVLNFEYIPAYEIASSRSTNQEAMKALHADFLRIKNLKLQENNDAKENLELTPEDLDSIYAVLASNKSSLNLKEEEINTKKKILLEQLKNIGQSESQMKKVGQGMKYANPLVWMMYKYFAYQNGELGSKPIKTVQDLVEHCKSETYICTKRFHFLNQYLIKNNFGSIGDVRYFSPQKDLSELFMHPGILKAISDEKFMDEWKEYERLKEGDLRVNKWENYTAHMESIPARTEVTKMFGFNFFKK